MGALISLALYPDLRSVMNPGSSDLVNRGRRGFWRLGVRSWWFFSSTRQTAQNGPVAVTDEIAADRFAEQVGNVQETKFSVQLRELGCARRGHRSAHTEVFAHWLRGLYNGTVHNSMPHMLVARGEILMKRLQRF